MESFTAPMILNSDSVAARFSCLSLYEPSPLEYPVLSFQTVQRLTSRPLSTVQRTYAPPSAPPAHTASFGTPGGLVLGSREWGPHPVALRIAKSITIITGKLRTNFNIERSF